MVRKKPKHDWSARNFPNLIDAALSEHRWNLGQVTAADLPEPSQPDWLSEHVSTLDSLIWLLENADKFWATKAMTVMAVAAADTVPTWTPSEALPADNGFMAFERPIGHISTAFRPDGKERFDVSIDAIGWAHDRISEEEPRIGIALYSRLHKNRRDVERSAGLSLAPLTYIGKCLIAADKPMERGAALEFSVPENDAARQVDVTFGHVTQVLGSTWLLMQSGQEVEQDTIVEPVRRRSAGSSSTYAGDIPIRLVNWTKPLPSRRPDDAQPGQYQRRRDTRWWVAGHWRQQAYGPSRSLRRPVWIESHTAGPKDAPEAKTAAKPTVYRVDVPNTETS